MRMAALRRCLGTLAALLMLAPLVLAEGQPYVVIVGMDNYGDKVIKPRAHAEDDAKALYDLFANKAYSKAGADHVKLFLSKKDGDRPSEEATRENVLKAAQWAFQSAKEDDTVIFAWFGQGGPFGDRTCYFTTDTKFQEGKFKDALSAAELEPLVDKTKSNRICVLLDVNYTGYDVPKESISELGLDKMFTEFDGKEDDAEEVTKPIVILSATTGRTASQEVDKHGLFATVLLEALRGKADTDGNEADGMVTVGELAKYVGHEIPMRSKGAKPQLPLVFGRNLSFEVSTNPEAAALATKRLAQFEELVKEGKVNEEVASEGRKLLKEMPRWEAQRSLRKSYQELADGKLTVDQFGEKRTGYLKTMKTTRKDAETFADAVLKIANIAKELYVRKVEIHNMAADAVKGLYKAADEKMPKELTDRLDGVKSLSRDEIRTLLADARQTLGNRDDLKGQKAADLALDRMLHSLDPYSAYIDADAVEEFEKQTKQVFIGVGIQIQKDRATDMIRVSTPLRGGPAYKAGIVTGDVISKITNYVDREGKKLTTPEVLSTKGMDSTEVVKKILGPERTRVGLTIVRDSTDGTKEIDFDLNRGRIEVETVYGVSRNDDASWNFWLDKDKKIAYIRLSQFAQNTYDDLKAAMDNLHKEGMTGLILDLRFNPGGYLDSAVKISDLFIDDGVIVTIRPREGKPVEKRGHHAGSMLDFPMVVLVNGMSASASEIVSACLQDQERAMVMGERSFGKGSVQNIMSVPTPGDRRPSELKLTTASFWRPSNQKLHRERDSKPEDPWGVVPHPDYTIKLGVAERSELFEHLKRGEVIPRKDPPKMETVPTFTDRQLNMAAEFLKKQAGNKTALKKAG